jgi:molybdopterin/thiamine biosynthesis adenylyltransferase
MTTTDPVLPQVKHTSPVFGPPELVQIGGYGQITEIPDPDGAIRRLLQLLDGTRTIAQAASLLRQDYPHISPEEVEVAVAQFDEAGFLLDAAKGPKGILDEYELGRWERNINFFGSYVRLADNKYELQGRLRDCRITLLGLGGLGSHLLLDMAAMGVGHVRAVEFDRVELSNLNRQILYRDADVGQEKLHLAVARVREFNPHIDIEPISAKLSSAEEVIEVATGADLVICVADRPKMEIINWVNEGCVRLGVPLVTGGLDTQRAVYYTMIPGRTGCVECWRRQVTAVDTVSSALLEEKRERQIGGDNAAFGPLVTMTTGLMLGELTRLITGIAPPVAAGRLMQLAFDDYAFSEAERWERQPDCPVCSTAAAFGAEHVVADSFADVAG